jgi:hypothetical protein
MELSAPSAFDAINHPTHGLTSHLAPFGVCGRGGEAPRDVLQKSLAGRILAPNFLEAANEYANSASRHKLAHARPTLSGPQR